MSDLNRAIKIVRGANKILSKKFQTLGLDAVRMKKNQEIVTDADMTTNKFITAKLLKYFPNDDIVSEEAKKIDNPGKNTWFVDPLDGTTNFSYGLRDFATCLARVTPKHIQLGVVGLPLAKEIYWAEAGGEAFLNGEKITVSRTNNHGAKSMVLLCGGHSPVEQKKFLQIIQRLDPEQVRLRILSSAGIETSAVACGRADGYITTGIKPWDVLAGVIIIRAAGGRVTNFTGDDWTLKDSTFVASNGIIHDKLLALVR